MYAIEYVQYEIMTNIDDMTKIDTMINIGINIDSVRYVCIMFCMPCRSMPRWMVFHPFFHLFWIRDCGTNLIRFNSSNCFRIASLSSGVSSTRLCYPLISGSKFRMRSSVCVLGNSINCVNIASSSRGISSSQFGYALQI